MKGPSQPPQHVPLLTEVVDIPGTSAEPDVPYPPQVTESAYAITEPATIGDRPAELLPSASLTLMSAAEAFPLELPKPSAWNQAIPLQQPLFDESAVVGRVLADLDRQLDLMFEHRVRETLAPILARLTDALVREVRNELSAGVREMVTRAVSLELDRHHKR